MCGFGENLTLIGKFCPQTEKVKLIDYFQDHHVLRDKFVTGPRHVIPPSPTSLHTQGNCVCFGKKMFSLILNDRLAHNTDTTIHNHEVVPLEFK